MAISTASSGSVSTILRSWAAQWQQQALSSPCGSCNGRACSVCSIRIGGPSKNGQPSGYAPRILEYDKPDDATTTDTNNLGVLDFAALLSYGPGGLGTTDPSTVNLFQPSTSTSAAPSLAAAAAQNAIVLENQKPGTPESVWLIGQADSSIEGYAAQFTIDNGQRVDFKISTNATNYRIDIYRLGYYGGNGARLITTINKNLATAQTQPLPLFDPTTKLVDAGNWSVSASWDIPADAVSGIYFAELTRLDTGGQNIIPFIVRDDQNPSDITFQTSDTTWQAYNWWGGYNFYGGVDQSGRIGRSPTPARCGAAPVRCWRPPRSRTRRPVAGRPSPSATRFRSQPARHMWRASTATAATPRLVPPFLGT